MDCQVKMVSEDEESFTVGGYGVVFGGRDLYGETFSKNTDFMTEDVAAHPPTFYDHALGSVKAKIGNVVKQHADDIGIWMEAQIEKSKEYAHEILELVKQGRLGYSTGSAPHLVERVEGLIKRWPIIEVSLTPTPAEPRTLGVEHLRSIGLDVPEHPGSVTEAAESQTAEVAEDTAVQGAAITEKKAMDEKDIKTAVAEAIAEREAEAKAAEEKRAAEKAAFEAAVQAEVKKVLEGEYKTVEGVEMTQAPAIKQHTKMDGDHDGTEAFKHWMRTGQNNYYTRDTKNRPEWKEPAANQGPGFRAAYQEGTAAEGGVLVPKDLYARIIEKRDESSIPHRAGALVIPTSRDSMQVPSENATASFTLTAEEASATQSEGTLNDDTVTVYKWMALSKASNELLEDDATDLEGWISRMFGRAAAAVYNQYTLIGPGS